MTHETSTRRRCPSRAAGRAGAIDHDIYLTRHGVVQGWTTVHGKPVAVVNQRSTYNHDVDSVVGFLGFGRPVADPRRAPWMARRGQDPATRSTGSTSTTATPATSSAAATRCGRPTSTRRCPTWGDRPFRVAGLPGRRPSTCTRSTRRRASSSAGTTSRRRGSPPPTTSTATGQVYRSQLLVRPVDAQAALAHRPRSPGADVVQAMETAATAGPRRRQRRARCC